MFPVSKQTESEQVPLQNNTYEKVYRPTEIAKPKKPFVTKLTEILVHRIHILSWITHYDRETAIADLIAGITLGLTIIPQGIAYASLANLPSQYGLYAAFIGSFLYVIFGSVKEVSIGPTSLMAFLTLTYTFEKPIEYIFILAFLCGIVELSMGIFKLGFIVDFISTPTISAFTSGTSLIIIASQLKSLFGVKYSTKGFISLLWQLVIRLQETRLGDTIMGLMCIAFLLFMRKIKDLFSNSSKSVQKGLWYLSISRNALCVLISSLIAYFWSSSEKYIKLTGKVEQGIPTFEVPAFTATVGNETIPFTEIVAELGTGLIFLPLVAVLANVAIAKAFTTGKIVDASQEMIALGIANLLGSFFRSMPTCGAFTRSAVSHASGVQTPMAGIYSAIMVLLSLSLLTPYFYFIPRTTLAAVLICAVLFMIDFGIVKKLYRESKFDLFTWIACIIACLTKGVEFGLLVGIVINICYLLFMWARPASDVRVEVFEGLQYIQVKPNAGIFYPGIDYLREKISQATIETNYKVPVILDCSKVSGFDYTSLKGLHTLAKDLMDHKQILVFKNIDDNINKLVNSDHPNILFCENDDALREVLIQNSHLDIELEEKS